MIDLDLLSRHRQAVAGALFAAVLALLPACGSSDQRPLVLVNVPLGTYAVPGNTVQVTITLDGVQATQKVLGATDASSGNVGIYLPSGSSGTASVTVVVLDASGCAIATGSGDTSVTVRAGKTSGPVSVTLSPSAVSCVPDDGGVDGKTSTPADAGVGDGPLGDTSTGVDVLLPVPDGPPALVDTQPGRVDAPASDVVSASDTKPDAAIPNPDVPEDVPPADLAVSPDLGSDGPVDAPPTTMNIMANCTAYTHAQKDSTGAIENWAIYQVAFSPDGKILISFGEDGRAKLWNVTAAGLSEPSSGLVFASTNLSLNGAISQDGNYVAIGDRDSEVTVFDLPASLQYGAPTKKWSLPVSALSVVTGYPDVMQFTTDGGHLVVAYRAYSQPDPNQFVVWDLTTQTITRHVDYANEDRPMACFPGSYTGAMWVASAASVTDAAGDYVSTVTLMDVSQASPAKAQVTVPGFVANMAFSPDGATLAIAFYSGEVSLWDITSKSSIARLGNPLVAASTSAAISAYALAYTKDGKYLAAGVGDGDLVGGSMVSLVQLQQKIALQRPLDYFPFAAAFAPDGLGLAVGEANLGVLLYCRP
jgi:WD40 repeat protein